MGNYIFALKCIDPEHCALAKGNWCQNANTNCDCAGHWHARNINDDLNGYDECFCPLPYNLSSDNLKSGEFLEKCTTGEMWFWGKKFNDGEITGSEVSPNFEVCESAVKINENFYFLGEVNE
jgi:hypothetical protein